jgi:hypothetical protein
MFFYITSMYTSLFDVFLPSGAGCMKARPSVGHFLCALGKNKKLVDFEFCLLSAVVLGSPAFY